MYVHFNMDSHDFLDQLRAGAIKSGARPQLIAAIDDLATLPTYDEVEAFR